LNPANQLRVFEEMIEIAQSQDWHSMSQIEELLKSEEVSNLQNEPKALRSRGNRIVMRQIARKLEG